MVWARRDVSSVFISLFAAVIACRSLSQREWMNISLNRNNVFLYFFLFSGRFDEDYCKWLSCSESIYLSTNKPPELCPSLKGLPIRYNDNHNSDITLPCQAFLVCNLHRIIKIYCLSFFLRCYVVLCSLSIVRISNYVYQVKVTKIALSFWFIAFIEALTACKSNDFTITPNC